MMMPLFGESSSAWVTPMVRRPKRHQNPPLILAPSCGPMNYKSAFFGGFAWAWVAHDTDASAAASMTRRARRINELICDLQDGESATRNPCVG